MADSRSWLRAGAIAAILCASGCVQKVGDLGRPAPSLFPQTAYAATDGAASFNETDQEREMHDRVWRFLRAPHVNGWFFETLAVTRRGLKPAELEFERGRYYRWLHDRDYQSSRVRFNTAGDDVSADLGTLPGTFRAICAVNEIDRGRRIALEGLGGLEPEMAKGVSARQAANATHIEKFRTALRFRFEAYSYALDHLLVETPHEEAVKVDALLGELAVYVDLAERERFCDEGVHSSGLRGAAVPGLGAMEPLILEPDRQN